MGSVLTSIRDGRPMGPSGEKPTAGGRGGDRERSRWDQPSLEPREEEMEGDSEVGRRGRGKGVMT